MQVKVIKAVSPGGLEKDINKFIKELNNGGSISDNKVTSISHAVGGSPLLYTAIISYEEK